MAKLKTFGFKEFRRFMGEQKKLLGEVDEWHLDVGMPYAWFLEFGTVRVAPRPFIRPGVQWLRARWSFYRSRIRPGKTALNDVTKRMMIDLREKIAVEMEGPKSGIKWPHLPNRSSAPGEAPAVQSSDLRDSMRVRSESGKPVRKLPTE